MHPSSPGLEYRARYGLNGPQATACSPGSIPTNNEQLTHNIHSTNANMYSAWSCWPALSIRAFCIACIQIRAEIWTKQSTGYHDAHLVAHQPIVTGRLSSIHRKDENVCSVWRGCSPLSIDVFIIINVCIQISSIQEEGIQRENEQCTAITATTFPLAILDDVDGNKWCSTWSWWSALFIYASIITWIEIQRKIWWWTEWSPGYCMMMLSWKHTN